MSYASKWEEVKALAADFQRTQLSGSLQKLSERNCVEIVKKLIELNLVDVIFTCDGKEYITPQHLVKEISDELIVSGGRIHLTDLVSILNVDYNHIESKAAELTKSSFGDVSLVLGQLVNSTYKDSLASEINDRLQREGVITIAEITKNYDLPSDFLQELIDSRLNVFIFGVKDQEDSRTLFTEAYLDKYKSKITGVMSAVTQPLSLSQITSRYNIPEKIFNMKSGRLCGTITGSGNNRTFVPNIYSKTQNEWVDQFYKQNGYIEFDAMSRMGISDHKSFLKKKSDFEGLIYLNSCCVGKAISLQVDSGVEECINSKSWIDFTSVLPTILTDDDISLLIQKCLSDSKAYSEACVTLSSTIVASKSFIDSCVVLFDSVMLSKADEDLKSGKLFSVFAAAQAEKEKVMQKESVSSKKDERKKKAKGKEKSGGGTQGREVKMKAVKKKYLKGTQKADDSDVSDSEEVSATDLVFMTVEEITDFLQRKMKELDGTPIEFVIIISKYLIATLTAKYYEVAKALFANSTTPAENVKKAHSDVQQIVNNLYANIVLHNKALKVLTGDLQSQLEKHLLRTLCSDLLNSVVAYLSSSEVTAISGPEVRIKLINKLDEASKQALTLSHNSLNVNVDEFLTQFENSIECCDIMLKKVDKKREKPLISENRQNLILQLNETANEDAALVLHVAVLLQFNTVTQQLLHASGKFVPQLIVFLKPQISEEMYALFHECEELVVKQRKKDTSEDEKKAINERLPTIVAKVKELAIEKKKQNV
ncbi:E3 UFM1-protein ligase 1-like protein [Leptotrombidium deliense]|uniref:E3 UFM1-protein ligase 1 homolog n=1 Tax=Leptotrombidium deliense TaxID=299467 RepID=A0A443SC30_9ACAR|nr:E3 UFM1-protein ligase 1-like protein [Leptotrombidium deliense]